MAATVAAGLAAVALAVPVAHASDCAGADTIPDAENVAVTSAATLCLVNAERAAQGKPALRRAAVLDFVSADYSRRMVTETFFGHVGPDGSTVDQRLTAAGYGNTPQRDWTVGENIAWGQDTASTPREIVAGWMASEGHRRNILSDRYGEVGVGIVPGTPGDASWGATYTTDFGVIDAATTRACDWAGTDDADKLVGTSGADDCTGAGGDDDIEGVGGDDVLDGGPGADDLTGGLGIDTLIGQDGNDTLQGGRGDDELDGGAGSDRLVGGSGFDRLTGGTGDDVLAAGVADPGEVVDCGPGFDSAVIGPGDLARNCERVRRLS
jgi:uncharacterized protein YkwD